MTAEQKIIKTKVGVNPHSEQNFAVGDSSVPQLSQARASAAPHSSQNFAPGRFSCRHRGHLTSRLLRVSKVGELPSWQPSAAARMAGAASPRRHLNRRPRAPLARFMREE
jgi:hypothetical protein